MPARGRLTLLAVLLAGAGLTACGDDPTTEAASTTTDATTTTAADRPVSEGTTTTTAVDVEVPEFLDFVAPDVRGGQVTGAELAGQDLVIWFWAPW